jgi:carbamoyl-phosphate synthase large subunit
MIGNRPIKVLVLGSGALKIGEAGEFDYSGSQAIKALKEEGVRTVLVNPNIATIQTSEYLADEIYFLPVTPFFIERVIEREKPDGILLGFGGQTALNCGIALHDAGVFSRYGVEVLGTAVSAIRDTEDRERFATRLSEIDVKTPQSGSAKTLEDALHVAERIGYPVMLRAAYALGGLGSGHCANRDQLRERVVRALAYSPQVLVEEYLVGWKEIEYEVVRDRADNCITVCNMENLDPIGIHTGESIVVAPSQTLTNREYHMLRELSIRVIRHLGIIGECNIQFALDPRSEEYRVIEVNARLSRSSALASKATGYPLARVAAQIALGHELTDLRNSVTGVTTACFEPALDYVVVKIPRWDLQKFRGVSQKLGSAMKSVGEVMAIGRRFEEALQKGLRMLEIGVSGLVGNDALQLGDLETELREPTHLRVFAVAEALRRGFSIEEIHRLTWIDPYFIGKLANIVEIADAIKSDALTLSSELLHKAKTFGFSDAQLAAMTDRSEAAVRDLRMKWGIIPRVKQIDTLASEYPAQTNYLYLTYNGDADDVQADGESVIVLGSGPYRIGSSVEFDWCCVNTVQALRRHGYKTSVINCNPETVSTDYNECDRLYFEELNLETVLAICSKEDPAGVIVSMGGQVPNNLAVSLWDAGVPVLGTAPASIDRAEDRHKFSALLDHLEIEQPEWKELSSLDEAKSFANRVGYPVIVRPSYVLSGSAMSVASSDEELTGFLAKASMVSPRHPVVLSKFVENAKELEIDAVACDGKLVVSAISEHIENAGVHSGDATIVLPPQRTYLETMRRIRRITEKIAAGLAINGPFNIQFIAKDNDVKVIECNLRASRSFPFVSKILDVNFVEIAMRVIMGDEVHAFNGTVLDLAHVGVKAPQFSFLRLEGADPTVGVEMASTGEVGCLGSDFDEAFLKALLSVGYRIPVQSVLLSTGPVLSKAQFIESARVLAGLGVRIYATSGTAEFLRTNGIDTTTLYWPLDRNHPNVMDYIEGRLLDLVVNIPKSSQQEELTNDYLIRRRAVDFGIPLITNIQLAEQFVRAISRKRAEDLEIRSWREYAERARRGDDPWIAVRGGVRANEAKARFARP